MEQVKLPFRADIVGSFLRPERLKKARKDFESGLLSPAALQQIEDEEIEKLIAEQKVVGLQVITDGEFRRSWWHLDFFWGLGEKGSWAGICISQSGNPTGICKSDRENYRIQSSHDRSFPFHPETGWPGDTQANDSFSGTTFGRVDPRGKYG